jgi:molybdenum cofactor cytidylyltransferase
MRRDLAVLILAAGASRRLGRPKALVRLAGETLAARSVRLARALRPGWVGIVLGASGARVAHALGDSGAALVHAPRWREGLAGSLRAGFAAVPPRARRVLILAVDQWALRPKDLISLLAHRARGPVAAAYAGTRGIPVVFPRAWRVRLARLRGDRGARVLLAGTQAVGVALAAAAQDLDTPADLRALRRVARRKIVFK